VNDDEASKLPQVTRKIRVKDIIAIDNKENQHAS
jgi:hypothetical protein